MQFFSAIPSQLLETTITSALLQGLSNPSRRKAFDPTPYQLYQMRHYPVDHKMDVYTPPTPLTNPVRPTKICPPAPRIQYDSNLWY